MENNIENSNDEIKERIIKEKSQKTVLVVDDEKPIVDILVYNLKKEGYNTLEANDGEEAVRLVIEKKPDLVLLDIMLPIYDGQYVLQKIRETSEVPVIMMTAKSGDVEQVKSFGNGVDDYIKKPFMLALLKARIEAVLKRTYKSENRHKKLEAGKLSLDCKARKVYVNNQYIVTTPKEFDLLSFFIENQNVTLKREQILDAVWGPDYDGTYRTVDTIVKQIRIKLSDECPYIKSIYGIGYIFEVEDV